MVFLALMTKRLKERSMLNSLCARKNCWLNGGSKVMSQAMAHHAERVKGTRPDLVTQFRQWPQSEINRV